MNKVKQIIDNEFDSRLGLAVLSYTLGQLGQDQAASLTDDDIEKAEGNALMTKDFVQSLMKCAKRVASECSFTNDIVPYIIEEYGYLSNIRKIAEKLVMIEERYETNHTNAEETINNIRHIEHDLRNGFACSYIRQLENDINESEDEEYIELCEEVLYMLKAMEGE